MTSPAGEPRGQEAPAPEGEPDGGVLWYDDEAGPMVRLYTMTRGRARPPGGEAFDLITHVVADGPHAGAPDPDLDEEHCSLLEHCRSGPLTVADLASAADLPLGVVRVLLGDLVDAGHVRACLPVPQARRADPRLLREVISGLRAL
ncbi:DUF742 domain-containing protein [Streptomyces sp. HB2AG]|uniref:DUF742 domain-containing protein n=1 Tax=Streptomyces sp. HB2AG TaxID=2983400 RepID=UPI0022AA0493|nr:DUF742 domain-containing protein [Streptomyces sp. HB2AG]MCZ2524872.1 DUF742 domain-containing protein [Streptomyces sp. HB2AG]